MGPPHPERSRDRALRRRRNQLTAMSQVRTPGAMRRQSVSFVHGLKCRECARPYPAEALHVCEFCFGPLEVTYDYEAIAAAVSRESIAAGPRSEEHTSELQSLAYLGC